MVSIQQSFDICLDYRGLAARCMFMQAVQNEAQADSESLLAVTKRNPLGFLWKRSVYGALTIDVSRMDYSDAHLW